MAKYLGIDYGRARIGLAVSDEEANIAFPRPVLQISDEAEALRRICELAAEEGAAEIVIGIPPTVQGLDTTIREEILVLADRMRDECGLTVHLEDEMFTTRIASQHSGEATVDSAAAALILQSFLDKRARE